MLDFRWLFWHDDGFPYANIASQLAGYSRALAVHNPTFRRFRFHDLRHAFAVNALKAGMSIYSLCKHLGHGSISVTEKYLNYLTPEEALAAKAGRHGQWRAREDFSPDAEDGAAT
jgi:integrase/recombinase XerD